MFSKYYMNQGLTTLGLMLFALGGCKKFVTEPASQTSISSGNIYTTDITAIGAQTGIYGQMMETNSIAGGGILDITFFGALSADELTLWAGNSNLIYAAYYTNELTSQNTGYSDFWNSIYPLIYQVNAGIQGLNASNSLTPAVKQQLLGEAEFMRGFFYFYLVNLYGDVPLVLTPNYTQNIKVSRTPQSQVWQQIISDLTSAQQLLSSNYLDGTLLNTSTYRLRPTKWAASALLARACLYDGQWANAVAAADTVINNTSLFNLATLNNVFLSTSTEAIWQLQPVASGWNAPDAEIFIIPSTGLSSQWPVYLSGSLLSSFEPNDQRRVNWVDSTILGGSIYYYPYKYKIGTFGAAVKEYEMVLRLGELYLIRAEAEAELNDLTDAANDVNKIRVRSGLPGLADSVMSNQASLLAAIQHERKIELFTEWGHRWLDMKRTGSIDSIMGSPGNAYAAKFNGIWNADWQWYPISSAQLQADAALTQNQGY